MKEKKETVKLDATGLVARFSMIQGENMEGEKKKKKGKYNLKVRKLCLFVLNILILVDCGNTS